MWTNIILKGPYTQVWEIDENNDLIIKDINMKGHYSEVLM